MSGRVHDRALLDALDSYPAEKFEGRGWRTTFESRDPLLGSTAGGRWGPPGSFEVLYTSCDPDGSLAEIYHDLSMTPVFSYSNVLLAELQVTLQRVLQLTNQDHLVALGLDDPRAKRIDTSISHAVGAAAHFLEFQAILVPSARWECNYLVILMDRIDLNEDLIVVDQKPVNWSAWKESHSNSMG